MVRFFKRFLKNDQGATVVEYGLIAVLVSIVILGAVQQIGSAAAGLFGKAEVEVSKAAR